MVKNIELFEMIRGQADKKKLVYKYEERGDDKYLTFGVLDIDLGSNNTLEIRVYSNTDPDELLLSVYSFGDTDSNTVKIQELVKKMFDAALFQYRSQNGMLMLVEKQANASFDVVSPADSIYFNDVNPDSFELLIPNSRI